MIPFLYEWRLHKSRIENLFRSSANNASNFLKSSTFITVYQHVSVKWQAKVRPLVSSGNPVPNPGQQNSRSHAGHTLREAAKHQQRATDKKQLEIFIGLLDRDMCGVDLVSASASLEDSSGQYVLTSNGRSQPASPPCDAQNRSDVFYDDGQFYVGDDDRFYVGNNSGGQQGTKQSQADKGFVTIRIKVKIHPSVFTTFIETLKIFPTLDPAPQWLRTMFGEVEANVPCGQLFSDITLVAEDGLEFQCHKMVLGRQSNVLAAMLSNPTTKECKEGVLRFPTLDGTAMHTLLKFLYLGELKYGNDMSTRTILQLLDTAEQYGLQNLKTFCAAALWRRVVETPEKATEIFVAANTYNLELLKKYALGVLVENYDSQQEETFRAELGCDLYDEVFAYTAGRINVTSHCGSGQEGVSVRVVIGEQEWQDI